MSGNWTETSQKTIKEVVEFGRSLAQTIAAQKEPDRLRAAVDQALSAECVQCGIRLTGWEVLQFGEEVSTDARVERLRSGYCARNGCESLFYRVTCAPHPEINWPALLNPTHTLTEEERNAAEQFAKKTARAKLRNKALVRTSIAVAALLIVFVIRQIWVGGSIPFIREPEEFRVDREAVQP
jgi:hypothetical protein